MIILRFLILNALLLFVDLSGQNQNKMLYEMLVKDKCLERRTDVTLLLIGTKFDYPTDPTGLDRYPLQVAIDNQSKNCYDLIVGIVNEEDYAVYNGSGDETDCVVYDSSENYREYFSPLDMRDELGWRPVEHALKHWPLVALHTLPYHTFIKFEPEPIKELIIFAMKNNLLPSIYFLRSLFIKWPVDEILGAQRVIIETILEVFLELEDCDSDISKIFFMQAMNYFNPIEFYNQLSRGFILNLYNTAMERQCTCFLSSPVLYPFLIGDDYLGLLEKAFDEKLPLVFKSLVEAKIQFFNLRNESQTVEKFYEEIREFFKTKMPFLEHSPGDADIILSDYEEEEIQEQSSESGIDFIQSMTVFFDINFIPNDDLRRSISDSENIENLPNVLYKYIPLSFVLSLLKPELIITEGNYSEKAILLISCYSPEILKTILPGLLSEKNIYFILNYVLSSKCRAPEELKKESVRILTENNASKGKVDSILSKVIKHSLTRHNYRFAYKAAILKKRKLDYEIIYEFLSTDPVSIEYVFNLMEMVPEGAKKSLNTIKKFHDKLIKVLYELKDKENAKCFSKLIGIILFKLWRIDGFNINDKVVLSENSGSVFKFLFQIENDTSFKLIRKMIKLFWDNLKISKEDKDCAYALRSKSDEHRLIADAVEYFYSRD